MSKQAWQLGQKCFLLQFAIDPTRFTAEFVILPATVVNIAGSDAKKPTAASLVGTERIEGDPYETEKAARAEANKLAKETAKAAANPKLQGRPVQHEIKDMPPEPGTIIYVLDRPKFEVLEARVSEIYIEPLGAVIVCYELDGNEIATEWYASKEAAVTMAKLVFGKDKFTFVSIDELAERTQAKSEQQRTRSKSGSEAAKIARDRIDEDSRLGDMPSHLT